VFDQALIDVGSKFSDVPTEELDSLIDAVAVRKDYGARVA